MVERNYNKGNVCEICDKRVVNGYKRCRSHRIILSNTRLKYSLAQLNRIKEGRHNLWKGNDVGYRALHHWVDRWLGKPDVCEFCRRSGLNGRQIHWANKSGNYLRELTDWIRLCFQCHFQYDKEKRRI